MASQIRSLIADQQGLLIALHLDGTISRQVRTDSGAEWQPVNTDEIEGRVVMIATRDHDNSLVALCAAGRLWEQTPGGFYERHGARHWRPLAGPA